MAVNLDSPAFKEYVKSDVGDSAVYNGGGKGCGRIAGKYETRRQIARATDIYSLL